MAVATSIHRRTVRARRVVCVRRGARTGRAPRRAAGAARHGVAEPVLPVVLPGQLGDPPAQYGRWGRPVNADRLIRIAAAATVAGLAGIAGAISYSHMRQLAQGHGQAGWHAHAFPLSVDGIEIVASLVLLADRRAGRRPGWLPWAALAVGTAGSLAANVPTAGPPIISRILASRPTLPLLLPLNPPSL